MGSGLYTYLLSIRSRSGSFLIISMTSAMMSGTTFRSSTALSRSLMEEGLQRGAHNHCLNNRLPSIQSTCRFTQIVGVCLFDYNDCLHVT